MTKPYFAALRGSLCLLLAAGLVILGPTGCGGDKTETAPPPAPGESATPAAPEAVANALPSLPALPPDAPVTLDVLRLMPASAQAVIAIPPLLGIEAKVRPLVNRFLPDPAAADAVYAAWVAKLGTDLGVADAKTLEALTQEIGVNANAPVAFFADLSPVAESYVSIAKAAAGGSPQKAAPATEADPAETGTESTDLMPESRVDAAANAKMAQPFYAVVMNIGDEAKARAQIDKAVEKDSSLRGTTPDSLEVDGVTITSYNPEKLSYFFLDKKFVMSNHLDLLKEVLAKFSAPATIRFGTESAPALAPDQIVGLLYGDRLLPVIEKLKADISPEDPALKPMLAQFDTMSVALRSSGEEDPWIMDIALDDKRLQFQSRMDTGTHPGVMESSGPASPLALAPLLPENTLAFLSFRLNEVSKKQFKEVYLNNPAAGNNEVAMGMNYFKQVMELLDDELTIGFASSETGFPGVILMANLMNPEATLGMLQMIVPITEKETYADAKIMSVEAPTPVPLSLVVLDKTLVLSNDLAEMKKIVDLKKAGEVSPFFAKLDPPLSTDTPRYLGLLINSKLISDVVVPLSVLAGGLPPAFDSGAKSATNVVRELRFLSELQGGWAISGMTVYLNDPAALPESGPVDAVPASVAPETPAAEEAAPGQN